METKIKNVITLRKWKENIQNGPVFLLELISSGPPSLNTTIQSIRQFIIFILYTNLSAYKSPFKS